MRAGSPGSRTALGAALAVLIAAAGIAYSSRGRDDGDRFRRLEADLADARTKLGALERRPPVVLVPAPPEESGAAPGLAAAHAAAPEGSGASQQPLRVARDPRADLDAPRRAVEKVATAMDQRLAAEERDAGWSGRAEQALRAAVSERAAGSKLLDVQCRKTFCRLIVRHAGLADKKAFASSMVDAEPFRAGAMYRYGSGSAEAELETNVYVVREGHDLQGEPEPMARSL